MIERIIAKKVDSWIQNEAVAESEKDVYIYGLDLLFSTCINIGALLVTSLLMGLFAETVIVLSVVVPMQCFCGGYHADTHLRCFLIMYIGWWLIVPVVKSLSLPVVIAVAAVTCILVFIMAPIPNPNVQMSQEHRKKMMCISRLLVLIFTVICFLLVVAHSEYYQYIAIGLAVISISSVAAFTKSKLKKGLNE